jgi:transposase
MPALVATRFNPHLCAKYKALLDAGKPPKLAIAAIMRKMLQPFFPRVGRPGKPVRISLARRFGPSGAPERAPCE